MEKTKKYDLNKLLWIKFAQNGDAVLQNATCIGVVRFKVIKAILPFIQFLVSTSTSFGWIYAIPNLDELFWCQTLKISQSIGICFHGLGIF
jgi:hypothetical protein